MREQILAMEPGRELDIRIIEDVLGAVKELNGAREVVWRGKHRYYFLDSFNPSTDIAAAFEVEKHMMLEEGHAQIAYLQNIFYICGIPFRQPLTNGDILKLIRLTPEQRCKAAVLTKMGYWVPKESEVSE